MSQPTGLSQQQPHIQIKAQSQSAIAAQQLHQVKVTVQPVTFALVGISLLGFALEHFGLTATWGGANQVRIFQNGEYYRLLVSMLIPASPKHILWNLCALLIVGWSVEAYFGHVRTLLIYLVGGFVGPLMVAFLQGPNVYSVGASGGGFALIGALLFLSIRYRHLPARVRKKDLGVPLSIFESVLLLALAGFGYWASLADWGHLSALSSGFVIAAALSFLFRISSNPEDSTKLVRTEIHPRAARLIHSAFLVVIALQTVVVIPSFFPRRITADNVSVTLPFDSYVFTDFSSTEFAELCTASPYDCLIVSKLSNDRVLMVFRDSALTGVLLTLQDYAKELTSALSPTLQLFSSGEIQVDGRKALRCAYNGDQFNLHIVLVKDQDTILIVFLRSSTTDPDLKVTTDSIIESIHFADT